MKVDRSRRSLRCGLLVAMVLVAACGRSPEELKRQYFESANKYVSQEKYREAAIEYQNAVAQDDHFAEARYKLAGVYIRLGNGNKALAEAVRAADLLPQDADAQLQATNLLILAGRYADAEDRARKLLAHDPRDVRATVALGNALAGLRDLNGAVQQLEEAVRLDPARAGSYTNLATLQLSAGRLKEAEGAYREAVAKAPDSTQSRMALAQFFWLTNRLRDAEEQVLKAVEIAPRDVGVNRFASAFYQASKQTNKAEQFFKTAVEADGTSAAYLAFAEYYIAAARIPEATAILQKLLDDKIVGETARVRLATIDYSAGRVEAAEKAIDGILKDDPKHLDALLVKASMLFDRKKYDDALARTNAAIKADPASAQAYFARGRVWAAMARWDDAKDSFNEVLKLNPRAAGAQIELSKLHLQNGATDTAVALAGAAVTSDPRRADARLILARGLIARRDFAHAESILADLQKAMPDSAIVYAQVGWLHLAKKEAAAATAAFQQAMRLDPLQIDALSGLVTQDVNAGRRKEALARVEPMVEKAPTNAGLLTLTGQTHMMVGNLDQAQEMFRRAIAADSSALDAYSYLGQAYLLQHKVEEARREFENRAQLEMHPVAALTMVGLIYQMENRTSDAQRTFEQVLAIDPKSSVAANNLAWIYAEHGGNLDVALQLAQTAQSGLPDSGQTADTLGWIYLKKELYSLSITALQRAVERDPKNASFQYHLGLAYARSGESVKARSMLETALRLDSTFDGAADAKKLLASLAS